MCIEKERNCSLTVQCVQLNNRKQFSPKDFVLHKGEYRLKIEKNTDYTRVFFDALIPYKMEIFQFVRSYYRCFMQNKEVSKYPKFEI